MPQAIPVKSPIFLFYQDNDVGVDKIGIGEYASYKGNLYVLDNKANVDKTTTVLQAVMHRNLLPLDMDTFLNQILAQMHQNGLIITSENLNKNFMNKADADALYIKSPGLGTIEAVDLLNADKDVLQRIWELKPGRYILDVEKLSEAADEISRIEEDKPEDERRLVYRWWAELGFSSQGKYLIDILAAGEEYRILLAFNAGDGGGTDCYWAHIPKTNNGTAYLRRFVDVRDPYYAKGSIGDIFDDLTPGTKLDAWDFTNNTGAERLTGVHNLTQYEHDRIPTGCPVQDKKAMVRLTNLGRYQNTYLIEIISTTEGIWYALIQENRDTHEYFLGNWTQVQGGGKGGGDVPVGTVLSWDSTLPLPTGYAAADGSEISKTDYNDLFNLVGNTFGQASDVNKFKLPNIADNREVSSTEDTPNTLVKRDDQGNINTKTMKLGAYFPVTTGVEPDKLKDKGYSILVRSTYGNVQMISAKDFFEKTLRGMGGGGTTITGTNSAITLDVDANENIDVNGELYIEGTTSDLNVERGDYFQAGQYGFFAMKNPKGRWLFCDGREISRADYPELFEAIGTTYGEGDGTTTFNIPDRRGYFGRCLDAGAEVDYQSDREIGSKQGDAVKRTASMDVVTSLNAIQTAKPTHDASTDGTFWLYKYTANTSPLVVGEAPENVVKNIAEYVCIRY